MAWRMHTLPCWHTAAGLVSHPVTSYEAFQDQPPCALVLRCAGRCSTAQLGNPGAKDAGAVEAGLKRGLTYDPRRGIVIRVAQIGPHAAEQHRHLALRGLDRGRKVELLAWFSAGSGPVGRAGRRLSPPPIPAQHRKKAGDRCRGKACKHPKWVSHGHARVPSYVLRTTSGTQPSPGLPRLRIPGASTDAKADLMVVGQKRYTERLLEAGIEPPLAASATATTLRWPRASSACSRPR